MSHNTPMILVFGDSEAKTFSESPNVTLHIFANTKLSAFSYDSIIRRTIERTIAAADPINYVVFCFGQYEMSPSHTKQYIEWIANILGKFRRIVVIPHYSCGTVAVAHQIKYYEYIYMLNKHITDYKLGATLVAINVNRRILDSNLRVKLNCDIFAAYVAEFKLHNIEL